MPYSPHQLAYFAHRLMLRGAVDSMDRMVASGLSVRDEELRRTASEFSGLAPACGPVAAMP